MSVSTAQLKNYRQSPRKVRLVADFIRGRSVDRSLALLSTLPKRAALPLAKLLRSAVSNAKGLNPGDLFVSRIEVNGGIVFRRTMPRARGRGALIRKKSSLITIELSKKEDKKQTRRNAGQAIAEK